MRKIVDFFKRPRNVYFSFILLLTLVTGLASISFSNYIDESNMEGLLEVNNIDNRLQSDDLVDNTIALAAHETKTIKVYIMSNNDFESKFSLYYLTDSNAKVYSETDMKTTIEPKEVIETELTISNFEDATVTVKLGISSALVEDELTIEGKELEILE